MKVLVKYMTSCPITVERKMATLEIIIALTIARTNTVAVGVTLKKTHLSHSLTSTLLWSICGLFVIYLRSVC